ncbi:MULTISPECIES: O-antigen ligase family protein [Sphingomonas]|uniref:O-antigen ligase family protein n=1 Tax=Sphingomonas TaxID=13687 RepID=UPI000B0188CB|nr:MULTISPECIES: O-antigen ligase family protein [unclassified Sphingomonas]MCW6532758.1 O-antigen ligase family protein [Sphingomonas lycopersici]
MKIRGRFFRRRQRAIARPILGSYTSPGFWQRHRIKLLLLVSGYSWFVGMFFAITTTYFLVPLVAPLALLAGLVIWLLPDVGRAPTKLMSQLLFAFVAVLLCWPNYIGIDFPGLPWITLLRLVSLPLGVVLLVSLSISAQFRRELSETLAAVPVVPWLLGAFGALAFLTVFWSTDVGYSANKFSVAMFSWFAPFFAAVYAFRQPGRLVWLGRLLWGITLLVCALAVVEAHMQKVLWSGHLPPLLSIQDDTVTRILSGAIRSATGKYRTVATFSTPLGLAEYLGLAAPFVLHFALVAKRPITRVIAAATFPLMFYVVAQTDSRMGMINMFVAALLYLFFWSLRHRQTNPESPIGTALLVGYPVMAFGFLLSTFFVGKIRHLVWGDGSQQSSNDMRMEQLNVGIPKILNRPWGWGMGRAPETLALDSIDNFYLTVGLEYGLVGLVLFFGMIAAAIWAGVRRAIRFPEGELGMMVPLIISLINFLIVKTTLSQQDSHGLVFVMLGALVAACWRYDQQNKPAAD